MMHFQQSSVGIAESLRPMDEAVVAASIQKLCSANFSAGWAQASFTALLNCNFCKSDPSFQTNGLLLNLFVSDCEVVSSLDIYESSSVFAV